MKAIILAAGSGTRLKLLTKNRPKCMVNILEKPLISYQLKTLKSCKVREIYIVAGYLNKKISFKDVNLILNKDYLFTNMVHSLFCAKEILNSGEDILISYGDIIYTKKLLSEFITSNYEINIAIDISWKEYWAERMSNPLDDAESLKLDLNQNILEIGKKTKNYSDINGQYMGLLKIKSRVAKKLYSIWDNLDKKKVYEDRSFNQMYMTTFIQHLINIGIEVKAIPFARGWVEIDSPSDITIAENWIKNFFNT